MFDINFTADEILKVALFAICHIKMRWSITKWRTLHLSILLIVLIIIYLEKWI